MTALDELVRELGAGVDSLSERAQVAFFSACSRALLPEYRKWAAHRGISGDVGELLERALGTAEGFAVAGDRASNLDLLSLLQALEASVPPGDSPDAVSSTFAQDCCICADISIRVLVEDYRPGLAIEYALEPALHTASERLFGVSQVGSGDEEDRQVQQILAHPTVASATDFVRWAIAYLAARSAPTNDDLAAIRARATALAP